MTTSDDIIICDPVKISRAPECPRLRVASWIEVKECALWTSTFTGHLTDPQIVSWPPVKNLTELTTVVKRNFESEARCSQLRDGPMSAGDHPGPWNPAGPVHCPEYSEIQISDSRVLISPNLSMLFSMWATIKEALRLRGRLSGTQSARAPEG